MESPHTPILLAALASVLRAVAAESDPLPTLEALCRALVERCGAAGARVLLPDPAGRPRVEAQHGDVAPGTAGAQVTRTLTHAGQELGALHVLAPPPWLLDPDDGSAPLDLLVAPLGPALALRQEAATRAREAARVQSLLEAGRATVSSLALKEVLRRAMQSVRDLFGAAGVAIWRVDASGAVRRYGSLGLREEYVRAVASLSPGEGVIGLALREGRPVAVDDLAGDARVRMRPQLEREGMRALLSAPLLRRGQPIGALTVYYRTPRRFTAADEESLAGLANQVAAAIDNALLHATTERALAEASAQRELLGSVVRHAQDGILALDGAARLVLFSPGCERLTGWGAQAALGRQLGEILACGCCPTPDLRPASLATAGYAELHVLTPQGELRWLGVTAARVTSRRAGAARTVAVLRDVTAARQIDELKTAILSTVSHELRTPLTAVRALSELLAEHEYASDDARQMAGTINRESERLSRLVENVLDVARIQAGRMPCSPRPLVLAPLLRDVQALLDGAHRRGRLVLALDDPLPAAWADPDRVRQVLDNLLDNAFKYSPPDAPVTVSAAVHGGAGAAHLVIAVSDRGPGIPPSQREQVFERFHRLADTPGGSGLGLYLCRGLVELMGGTIWAEPTTEGGACFRFTLPVAVAAADPQPAAALAMTP